jgi:alkylation response protein AidB-like acyl-CoA dehydrogenase
MSGKEGAAMTSAGTQTQGGGAPPSGGQRAAAAPAAAAVPRAPAAAAPDYVALARALAPAFAERAAGYDRAEEFPHENWQELIRTGYTKMTVPAAYGGGGADLRTLCHAQQILAGACGSTAFAINMHVHGLAMIEAVTGDASSWVYQAVADGAVIAGGFSEPGVGGNWWHPTTVATPTDGGYLLRGRKSFFTGFPGATLLFLTAALEDDRGIGQPVAFLVPRPERGLTVTSPWDAAGMRATGSHSIKLDDLFVESRYLLGEPGDLALLFMSAVHWAWCSFSAVFTGIARGALDEVTTSMRTRTLQVIGKPLAHLPGVQFKVADMATKLAAAEAYLLSAIQADHRAAGGAAGGGAAGGDPLRHYIEMSLMKTTVCRLAHEVVTLALQVQGGSALLSGSPLQRMYRDVTAGLLIPPMPDVVHEWAGKEALGVPVLAEPRWGG